MIFGIPTATYTLIHVLISLVAIGSGLIVVLGMITGKRLNGLTALFLITTVATSVTGFGFPFNGVTPGLKVGIISLVMLAIAILARYAFYAGGIWRVTYVITAAISLYLNVFVLIAQLFQKVAVLKALAPTGSEPPFLVAQILVLLLFIALTVFAARGFRRDLIQVTRTA
jgi:hypothetical protein